MRRLQTQEEIDRKIKRNHIIIGTLMIGILTLSSLGFALISSDRDKKDSLEKNEFGVNFFNDNGIWVANLNNEFFGFRYLPSKISDVRVNLSVDLKSYSGKPLYFVGTSGEGKSEILKNIGRYILRYQDACIDSENCNGNFPVKDCTNNLIIFKDIKENKTSVYQNESCIYISGDRIKGADAFLYNVLEVN